MHSDFKINIMMRTYGDYVRDFWKKANLENRNTDLKNLVQALEYKVEACN